MAAAVFLIALTAWIGITQVSQAKAVEIGVHQTVLVRRERRERPEAPARRSAPALRSRSRSNSTAYRDAITASEPVAYYEMSDQSGDIATATGIGCGTEYTSNGANPCNVNGAILGVQADPSGARGNPMLNAPGLIASSQDYATKFDGTPNQEILLPDSEFLNTRSTGYPERTVELWFKQGALNNNKRSIYQEGTAALAGINIYIRGGATQDELSMYAWDRGNNEVFSESGKTGPSTEYGTDIVDFFPIMCQIDKNSTTYAALVFDQEHRLLSGYIKPAGSSNVILCGQPSILPAMATIKHHGHGTGNAVIGGVGPGNTRDTGNTVMLGYQRGHNFVGIIDEVAIYNKALTIQELQVHVDAAAGTAPSDGLLQLLRDDPLPAAASVKADGTESAPVGGPTSANGDADAPKAAAATAAATTTTTTTTTTTAAP